MKRLLALVALPLILAGSLGTAQAQPTDPVTLGKHLVEHLGCLYCHGLGGRQGIDNPNAIRKYVPAWDEKEFIEKYTAKEAVAAVIRKGRFPAKDLKATGNPIPMPPWGNRLKPEEMDAMLAYIWSLRETPVESHAKGGLGTVEDDSIDPTTAALIAILEQNKEIHSAHAFDRTGNPKADLGRALVEHLGCLHCHGLEGRQGLPNPNAVRKYVPAWDEKEFIERYPVDDGVRYVITNGRTPKKDPAATSSPIPMPPWGNRLKSMELDAIVAYIWSLRESEKDAK
jgi:mono/diheme cytochrome c family protein